MHQEIEKLIQVVIKGDSISPRQREIIRNKAISFGEDPDECEMCLEISFDEYHNKESENPVPPQQPKNVNKSSFLDRVDNVVNEAAYQGQKRTTAAILAIFGGSIGLHHFYIGEIVKGVFDIIFCFTGIPFILGVIKGFTFLSESDEKFQARIVRNK